MWLSIFYYTSTFFKAFCHFETRKLDKSWYRVPTVPRKTCVKVHWIEYQSPFCTQSTFNLSAPEKENPSENCEWKGTGQKQISRHFFHYYYYFVNVQTKKLLNMFSLKHMYCIVAPRKYFSQSTYSYLEYHSVCPLVGIRRTPSPPSRVWESGGVPISDGWREILEVCLLCGTFR